MQIRVYLCALILLLAQVSTATAQNQVPQIRQADLSKTPIVAGDLRITITAFKELSLLGVHAAWIGMTVENNSSSFVTFSPTRLVFAGNDGTQVDILGLNVGRDEYLPALDRDLPPATHVKAAYQLMDRVELPARLFYDRHEIAVIVK